MSTTLILMLTGVQFVIQFTIWEQFREPLLNGLKRLDSHFSQKTQERIGSIVLIAANIGISLLVISFTSIGVIAGITNLFASAVLGLIMYKELKSMNKEPLINRILKFIKEN